LLINGLLTIIEYLFFRKHVALGLLMYHLASALRPALLCLLRRKARAKASIWVRLGKGILFERLM
jgi:hypothetical protein